MPSWNLGNKTHSHRRHQFSIQILSYVDRRLHKHLVPIIILIDSNHVEDLLHPSLFPSIVQCYRKPSGE